MQTAKSTCLEDLKKKREVQSLDLNRDGGYTEAAASWNDASVLRSDLRLDCQMFAEDQGKFHRTRFQMKAYFAPQFSALRQLCIEGGEKSFLASIGRCKPWLAQGGKSNVYFAKTLDERYIVKQMNRAEKQSFLEMAPEYLSYFSGILQPSNSEPRTCLAKILGAYQVRSFVFVFSNTDRQIYFSFRHIVHKFSL